METVTRFPERQGAPASAAGLAAPEPVRSVAATATFQLSEVGRKASLLAGGDGKAVQTVSLQVPPNRMHLVSVDPEGAARLRLRPRFERNAEQRVIRVDAAPEYDAPPTIDDLYRAAAQNHELEVAYTAERRTSRSLKAESEREERERVAQAFLLDKNVRALPHPVPSPRRCCLATERGRMFFDAASDTGVAKDVPREAHRRFRADQRAKRERDHLERAEQLRQHEEKKRFVDAWLAEHGSADVNARNAAGVLPMAEAVEAMTNAVFAAVSHYSPYPYDGLQRLQARLDRDHPERRIIVTEANLRVDAEPVQTATSAQWAMVREIQAALPEATVVLRRHRMFVLGRQNLPSTHAFGVLVTLKRGPLVLRREFTAPDH